MKKGLKRSQVGQRYPLNKTEQNLSETLPIIMAAWISSLSFLKNILL